MTRTLLTFALLLFAAPLSATAEPCRPDALGTARVMTVDAARYPRVGLKHFPQTLPLSRKEVVLTFDDGPSAATTARVLDTLAAECVRATFFLLGRNAVAHPALARRILLAGHTVGTHTFGHPLLSHLGQAAAEAEIAHGITAIDQVLGAQGPQARTAPFFRFPGFASTPALLDHLGRRGLVVFGADVWASDWNPMTPDTQLHLIIERIEHSGGGIVLFHDTQPQTAAMLPAFLRALKTRGFQVVHVVPAAPVTASAPRTEPPKAEPLKTEPAAAKPPRDVSRAAPPRAVP